MKQSEAQKFVSEIRSLCKRYGAWITSEKKFEKGDKLDRIDVAISVKITE